MMDHFKRIMVFLKAKNKKNIFKIAKEFSILLVLKKEIPFYYFAKHLYKKDVSNYKDFLSTKETRCIIKTLSPEKGLTKVIDNKFDFSLKAHKNDINTPEIYGHNREHTFSKDNRKFSIKDKTELISFLKKILETHQENAIFVKPMSGGQGADCHIFCKDSMVQKVEECAPQLFSKSFIFQKVICQHEKINAINPSSINTLRLDSYIDNQGNACILSGFMRFGVKGSVQDNASKGGFCVPINVESGTLGSYGEQLMKYGGKSFAHHPDTEFLFDNFKIPFFKEACALVKKGCAVFNARILGWDIAITPDGPVVIEANHNLGLFISDKMYGGLKKHPLFGEIESHYVK